MTRDEAYKRLDAALGGVVARESAEPLSLLLLAVRREALWEAVSLVQECKHLCGLAITEPGDEHGVGYHRSRYRALQEAEDRLRALIAKEPKP